MTGLKKRSTAVTAAIIVIILGTLFGVHRSIGAETRKLEAQFTDGVYLKDEKYTQPSIQKQLDDRATAMLGLVAVASNYPDLDDMTTALRNARLELMDAASISDKYAANEKLQAAYEKLYAALSTRSLPDNEKTSASSYAATMDGTRSIIAHSAYNSTVTEFNKSLDSFPVNILKNLAFVKTPEYFGAEGS